MKRVFPTFLQMRRMMGLLPIDELRYRYQEQLLDCAALREASKRANVDIAPMLAQLAQQRYKKSLPILLSTFALVAAIASVSMLFHGLLRAGLIATGVVLSYLFEILALYAANRRASEFRLNSALFHLVRYLEKHPDKWRDLLFSARVNTRIERAARALELLPDALRLRDVTTLTAIATSARRKAAAMRALKIWVVQPNPFTYTDLIWRLSNDLVMVLEGRWYDLPELEEPKQKVRTKWQKAVFVMLAVVSGAAAISIIALGAHLGPAATVLSSVLGIIAVALLTPAGVSTSGLSQLIDASSRIQKGK